MRKFNWKRYLFGKWHWSRPFKSLAFIYLALAFVSYFFGSKLVFRPPNPTYDLSFPGHAMIETSNTDKISIVWQAPRTDRHPVILFAHGNAEDIGAYQFLQAACIQRGWGFLAYDYPGYGISPGEPNEESVYATAEAAWHHLATELEIRPQNIILMGRSVGSGPTTYLAGRHECGGVVLISPFLSAFRTVTRIPLFPGDLFDNQINLSGSQSPLLVFHGENDEVIPHRQGQKLWENSDSPDKSFVSLPRAGHNDIFARHLETILATLEAWSPMNDKIALKPRAQ